MTSGRLGVASAACLAAASLAACAAVTSRSEALWNVVQACVVGSRLTGSPWPCLSVDASRRFAIVPDPKRRTQVLFTPTVRVRGIEDLRLLAPEAAGNWAQAWAARIWLVRRTGRRLRDTDVALAINSVPGRTQDQMHIHIDCLRSSTRRALDAALAQVGPSC